MGFAILTFCAVFLLIASGGLLLFYREAMIQRISAVINPGSHKQKSLLTNLQKSGVLLGGVVEHFENFLPKSQSEISVAQQRLIRAGYRGESAIKTFYGSKVVIPIALCVVALVSGAAKQNPFAVYVVALGLGYLAPDFWLRRQIKKRQKKIRLGLPDVLDLLIICIEAGLSMDHATVRTATELRKAHPDMCDELNVVVLEQRAGRPREETWKHLSERTDVDVVRNLVTMLVQSEQFGTSIAKMLRVHSDTLRTQRVQQVEELAAKTSVKLLFPLVFFIFPALFVVVLGPSIIMMIDNFHKLFGVH